MAVQFLRQHMGKGLYSPCGPTCQLVQRCLENIDVLDMATDQDVFSGDLLAEKFGRFRAFEQRIFGECVDWNAGKDRSLIIGWQAIANAAIVILESGLAPGVKGYRQ